MCASQVVCVFVACSEKYYLAEDGGPNCRSVVKPTADANQKAFCRELCFDEWELYKSQAMASSTPYNVYMSLRSEHLIQDSADMLPEFMNIAVKCEYGKIYLLFL